jgi:DNA repair protein RadC
MQAANPGAIKHWSVEERPREKFRTFGAGSLSDAELLAIILGSGTANSSAFELAFQVLESSNFNLAELSQKSLFHLQQIKGIGQARSMVIAAAMELGRRRQFSELPEKDKMTKPNDFYEFMKGRLAHLQHEEFWALALSRSMRVLGVRRISTGGIAGTVADTRIILSFALEMSASALAVFHNHPSGNLKPSEADIKLTKTIKQASGWMSIDFVDHLIITENGYYSFAEHQML